MKLLRCRICDELVRLRRKSQSCQCGASRGRYLNDRAVTISGPCELFGVRSLDYFSGEDWTKKLFHIPCDAKEDSKELIRSSGRSHHFHDVWNENESTYLWIEYLFYEMEALNVSIKEAPTKEEMFDLEEQFEVVIEEFYMEVDDIESTEQRSFIMENLPFDNKMRLALGEPARE